MLDANIVFRLDGAALEFLHERPFVQDIWLNHLVEEEGAKGLCLVTGERAAIARLHPSVKGVAGAQSSGASLVSFDKDAFKSFGKERGANAPVSERAAFAYTASLNTLLERDSPRRIKIGDATTVFWAEAVGDDARAAAAAEELFPLLVDPPTDAEENCQRGRQACCDRGEPSAGAGRSQAGQEHALLRPRPCSERRARIDSFLAPEHDWRTRSPHRRALARSAPRTGASADPAGGLNIPPTLGGALMRAILGGGRYPRSLLAAVIGRMRADKNITGLRAAICKACLWSCPSSVDTYPLGEEEESTMPKSRPPYPAAFRQQMVELVRSGRTPGELAREFEPSAEAIRNWVAQADRDAGKRSDGLRTEEHEEIRRLRRENRQLREEREILAKATAWFARETGPGRSTGS